jgi:hypothetical protein
MHGTSRALRSSSPRVIPEDLSEFISFRRIVDPNSAILSYWPALSVPLGRAVGCWRLQASRRLRVDRDGKHQPRTTSEQSEPFALAV